MRARMYAWQHIFLLKADTQWVTGLPQEPSQGPGEYPLGPSQLTYHSWERGLSPQWDKEVVLCTN